MPSTCEEDAECGSDGSISEAENRLSQQLDLRRARPANPPHSAWSELTGPGDGVFLTDNPDSTDTPHRSTVNNHSSHVEGVSGVREKPINPKRKGRLSFQWLYETEADFEQSVDATANCRRP